MSAQHKFIQSNYSNGSIARYAAVKDDGSGDVQETSADGDVVYGLAEDSADDNEKIDIIVDGIGKALVDAGTSISKGDYLAPSDSKNGKLEKHPGGSGDAYAAVALESADSDGEVIRVRLTGQRNRTS